MADLWQNPMGTAGFEFIEYAAPDPADRHEARAAPGWCSLGR